MATARIIKAQAYDHAGSGSAGKTSRVEWHVQVGDRRQVCRTRREAIRWCKDMGLVVEPAHA